MASDVVLDDNDKSDRLSTTDHHYYYYSNRSAILAKALRNVGIKELQYKGKSLVILKALSTKPHYLIIGGALLGISLPVTHYLSLLALQSSTTVVFRPGIVVAAVIVSVVCSMCAFWVMFRLLQWKWHWEALRIACTVMFG